MVGGCKASPRCDRRIVERFLGRAARAGESPVHEIRLSTVVAVPEYGGTRVTLPESGRTTFQG